MNFDSSFLSPEKMDNWELYSAAIKIEMRQCRDEGKDIAKYEKLAEAIAEMERTPIREEFANILYKALMDAPIRADYPYIEPSDLTEIRAARPADRMEWAKPDKDEALVRKIRGAWLGRICGCLLGKPVEGWHTPDIHKLLKDTDNFPLTRYMSRDDVRKAGLMEKSGPWAKWIDMVKDAAPTDDDTNYPVMASCVVSRWGRGFTPDNMAEAWVDYQPKKAYCTAERRAFRNFVIGVRPPLSAVYKNPEREYIGAQIRGDYFGYINPGDPELAAEMAWRDACISHVKNGIYGEMFVAAMLAVAAVCEDVKTVILEGLKQVPEKSRLTERVKAIVQWHEEGVSQEECFRRIHEEWDEFDPYDWTHTVSNAMIVAASLLYGEKDYSKSICMSVETGFDTDCNGATVGSILGMMLTDTGIDEKWSAPIHGRLYTQIFGMDCVSVDQLTETTMSHFGY